MKMKRKNVVKIGAILTAMGFAILFAFQANSQTVKTFIESIETKGPAPDTTPEAYTGPQTVKGLMMPLIRRTTKGIQRRG